MASPRSRANAIVPKSGMYVPDLGTISDASPLGAALFSRTRGLVLGLIMGNPQSRFYTSEIIVALGVGRGAVQRELRALTDAGILLREREGRQVYYRANPDCPIYPELVSLVRKTVGLVDVLRAALAGLERRLAVAFVYGSMARGDATSESDVDLMVIGEASFGDVVDALAPAQDTLGREVNPSVYTKTEFRRRLQAGEHFVTSVFHDPKLFVIGGPDDLERVAVAGLAEGTSDEPA